MEILSPTIAGHDFMDAFEPTPPNWTNSATHAQHFYCPSCNLPPNQAKAVWINRRSPVYSDNYRRKWQEFYLCQCDRVWWAWSSDRPPSEFTNRASFEEKLPEDWM